MTNWKDTGRYKLGAIISANCSDCGYEEPKTPSYRWSSGTTCVGCDIYHLWTRQVKWDKSLPEDEGWFGTDETRIGSFISANCEDCGYVEPPSKVEYRWIVSGNTCIGIDKYAKEIRQYYDEEEGWLNTDETRMGDIISANCSDCGYIPPPEAGYEWILDEHSFICEDFNKYERWIRVRIKDGEPTGEEMRGRLLEEKSEKDCGYKPEPQYEEKTEYIGKKCDNGVLYEINYIYKYIDNKWKYVGEIKKELGACGDPIDYICDDFDWKENSND